MNIAKEIFLDRKSSIPLYHQLREAIREYIISQKPKPHTPLPSESQMLEIFPTSRITIRLALNDLEKEGLIYKVQGKGTFISPPRISRRFMSMISFTEEIKDKGLEPSSKVLVAKQIPAEAMVAEKLKINLGEPVLVVTRIRYADGRPVGLNTSHLNGKLCPDLLETSDISIGSLYTPILERYGIRITKADRTLESILATPELAQTLDVEVGDPVLFLLGIAYTETGDVLDYCIEYYRENW